MKAASQKESFFLKKFIDYLNKESIPLEIVSTTGKLYKTQQDNIRHQLRVRDSRFVSALISPNALSFGEAYVHGHFDITGSIRELYEMVCDKLLSQDQRKSVFSRITAFLPGIKNREKENIEYHYNVPSDFYRLFLGETMGYTCGYYSNKHAGMDEAQNEKMDIICRKLRLAKNEELLDIGCGWGNFAVFAAKNYGVNVTGITLSTEQKKYADNWVEQEGLKDKIKIRILNYRDLGAKLFDKISCVGMSEHVGKPNMAAFFNTVYRCLRSGGLFMQHTITTNMKRKRGYENSFLNRYMFPGGELMFEHDLLNLASASGFELLNTENFRPHYVKTLDDWISRMEHHKEHLLKTVSENIYRIYYVFFIGSLISFQKKEISLFQNLFYKTDEPGKGVDPFFSPYSKNESRLT